MSTLNISLPDSMRAFIDEMVDQGSYSTASEYIRQLVREDQKRAAAARLETLLLEGIESGKPAALTDEWWDRKKQQLSESASGKKGT